MSTTQREFVLSSIKAFDGFPTAFQVFDHYYEEHLRGHENQPEFARNVGRAMQAVHRTCAILEQEGVLFHASVEINDSGEEVYSYGVEAIQRKPQIKVSKGYKEPYEQAMRDLATKDKILAEQERKLQVFHNDSVTKDQVAEAFYAAKETGNWESLTKLFFNTTKDR